MKFASSEEIIRILYPKIRGNSSDLPPRPQILPLQQTAIKELTAVLVHPSIPINVFFEIEADDVSALLLKTTFEKENLEKLDKIAEKSLDMPRPMNTRGDQGSLPDLEKALKTVDLRKIRRRLRIRMLHLCLPKITMFSSFNLKESLIQAGVKRVFDSSIVDAPRYAERVDQKQERLPLDNIRVSTHFLMEEDGITFAHYPAKNVTYEYVPGDIKEIDLEGVVNISMKSWNNLRKLTKVFYGHLHQLSLDSIITAIQSPSGLLSGNVKMFTFSSVCFSDTLVGPLLVHRATSARRGAASGGFLIEV
ncbi:uncharacterized protein Dana_GF26686 [Drosophila ananassae]|uniref:Serpin domain-containing protein n=1 Tax=Drosophila ananassae TaxID=7217 RepID=A0A0P9BZV7_DROAN|nr:uncharacterized protein Dana_GF26686 [Drosophila ananassae]